MSIYDATVEMLGLLSEEDLLAVNGVVKRFVYDNVQSPIKPLTEKQMLDQLALARQHVADGKCRDSEAFETEIAEKYIF